MNWDELREHWQHEDGGEPAPELLLETVRRRERQLHRKLRRRDLLETLVGLLLAPFFAVGLYFLVRDGLWLAASGSLWLTLCCLYVPWRLYRARRLLPRPAHEGATLVYLKQERAALQAQYELLDGVLRWYLGPIAIGVLLFYGGIKGPSMDTAVYAGAVAVVYTLIYWANRNAARHRLQPQIEQIDQQIRQLEDHR